MRDREDAERSDQPIRGKRVLVVEDEPWIAEILTEMLATDGHQVDTATNGLMALLKIERHSYDLIVSDLRMPELDGPGLYRELERWKPELLPRIVFVTGSAEDPITQKLLERSGRPCIRKPFTIADIHRISQDVLRAL